MAKRTSTPAGDDYDAYREKQADISREKSAKGREIGPVPPIGDIGRRDRGRESLRVFCEIYNPDAFSLGWSRDHLTAIARIEEAALLGALFAFAMARGSGKTTLCRMAALWALAYAIRRYVFVIGANAEKAKDTLAALKVYTRFLPLFVEDFPEISHAIRRLAGIANRSAGQTCLDAPTMIEWTADRIVFPTVPPPPNWPKHWPLRADGMVPTSGAVVSASGLTGEGIRGSNLTLMTGEAIRPDFVLLDDPQTHESARSKLQNTDREQLVSADVLGMAGPGQSIAAVMPCTVIEQGDFIDQILDREKHPFWRGERTGMLVSLPTNLIAWDSYFEIYRSCAQLEPPDFAGSNAYYVAHQAELEAGAEASWEDRKLDGEVSAIQHAMHLYCRDRAAFMAEYQNRPESRGPVGVDRLDAGELAARVTNLATRIVPRSCTRLTAFVDVGAHLLWYLVVSWDERFGGSVIDYGEYPDQRRTYFSSADVRPSLTDLPEYAGQQEAAIYGGLKAVTTRILGKGYLQEGTGAELSVERCMVDANWGPGTDLVYEFCRRSPFAATLYPSHGKFIGASSNPMSSWQLKPGERAGQGWRLSIGAAGRGRHVTFDTNGWKTFVAERLRTAEGGAGCLRLHAPQAGGHRLFADHCTAEYPVAVTRQSGGRVVEEWKALPGRDNHWWDCLVGAAVAASVQGLSWSAGQAAGEGAVPQAERKKVKWSEVQKGKRDGT
ncbi:MAG: hypothetical protein JWO38_4888 [Gemmataceae bacterium]|nr:hypothetical protein [Gemmataceae bacterium]